MRHVVTREWEDDLAPHDLNRGLFDEMSHWDKDFSVLTERGKFLPMISSWEYDIQRAHFFDHNKETTHWWCGWFVGWIDC